MDAPPPLTMCQGIQRPRIRIESESRIFFCVPERPRVHQEKRSPLSERETRRSACSVRRLALSLIAEEVARPPWVGAPSRLNWSWWLQQNSYSIFTITTHITELFVYHRSIILTDAAENKERSIDTYNTSLDDSRRCVKTQTYNLQL